MDIVNPGNVILPGSASVDHEEHLVVALHVGGADEARGGAPACSVLGGDRQPDARHVPAEGRVFAPGRLGGDWVTLRRELDDVDVVWLDVLHAEHQRSVESAPRHPERDRVALADRAVGVDNGVGRFFPVDVGEIASADAAGARRVGDEVARRTGVLLQIPANPFALVLDLQDHVAPAGQPTVERLRALSRDRRVADVDPDVLGRGCRSLREVAPEQAVRVVALVAPDRLAGRGRKRGAQLLGVLLRDKRAADNEHVGRSFVVVLFIRFARAVSAAVNESRRRRHLVKDAVHEGRPQSAALLQPLGQRLLRRVSEIALRRKPPGREEDDVWIGGEHGLADGAALAPRIAHERVVAVALLTLGHDELASPVAVRGIEEKPLQSGGLRHLRHDSHIDGNGGPAFL